jgi:tetratricopeptide (TPR) repeat protein/cold shock CspA family protein
MSFSASRLTIYAILSAIETDLRCLVLDHLEGQLSIEDILTPEICAKATDRLIRDEGSLEESSRLQALLYYVDFGDTFMLLNRHKSLLPLSDAKTIRSNTPIFERLGRIRNRIAHSRPLLFDDLPTTLDDSQSLLQENPQCWRAIGSVLRRLSDEPSFVLGIQIPSFYDNENNKSNHNLPTPDFDETGFLGRHKTVEDLVKLCFGPYPVITIVGEGGLGKTALAVKVAYDILDNIDCPYDAIVWTTSKSSQLTAQEIVKIDNAIADSLGMLTDVAHRLAGDAKQSDVMSEIIDYMTEFKILLILDNLETVIDHRLRDFLGKLPAGSKVIITSRIGIGAYEYPVKVQPLEDNEAIQLLRSLAKSRGVSGLVKTSNTLLGGYCKRMSNNPGFIKWFVSTIQAGKRPEEVLQNPALFLDYCMSNVYGYLNEDSKIVLRALVCLPQSHSQAELSFLTELEYLTLQQCLQQLLSTNMVVMSSLPRGSSFESRYELSPLTIAYLRKHHPVPDHDLKRFVHRRRQILAADAAINAERNHNPYSYYSLTVRSKSDVILAKYLRDALTAIRAKDIETALALVATAKSLSPEYFEVHRVEALVHIKSGNIPAAQSAYEAALDLEPESAPLHFWYGGFLLRYLSDTDSALIHFIHAEKHDPSAPQILLEISRSYLYKSNFRLAREFQERVKDQGVSNEWMLRKMYDLSLQIYARQASALLNQKDNYGALDYLERLAREYDSIPMIQRDFKMRDRLEDCKTVALGCEYFLEDQNGKERIRDFQSWLDQVLEIGVQDSISSSVTETSEEGSLLGSVDYLPIGKPFGFILTADNQRYFFHRSTLINCEQWQLIKPGARVTFSIGSNNNGECAVNVSLV